MSANQSNIGRKRRQGYEKSKTGCLTCRVRRVKCDESKPYCRRCTSTGRRCDGPVTQSYQFVEDLSSKLEQPSDVYFLPTLPSSNSEVPEGRAFIYFIRQAAPMLAGPMDAGFWAKLVPQLSRTEPIIWNTVLAISCLYEHPSISASLIDVDDTQVLRSKHQRQALKWYNKAIRDLNLRISQNTIDVATALLTCVLFVCIEYQQDNTSNALVLLEKGFGLCTSTSALTATARDDPVLTAVIPLFTRHAIAAATFAAAFETGHWRAIMNSKPSELDVQISNLQDARHTLYKLMEHSHAYLRLAASRAGEIKANDGLISLQEVLVCKLTDWWTSFTNMKIGSSAAETCAASILLAYYEASFIRVSNSLSTLQTTFDKYNDRFKNIVRHIDVLLSLENGLPLPFTFEIGVIPPLYFVGISCRHPNIRRRALALLGRSPKKESLWKALPIAKIVEKAMEIEEENFTPIEDLDASQPTPTTIGESSRIHKIHIFQMAGSGKSLQFAIKIQRILGVRNGEEQIEERVVRF